MDTGRQDLDPSTGDPVAEIEHTAITGGKATTGPDPLAGSAEAICGQPVIEADTGANESPAGAATPNIRPGRIVALDVARGCFLVISLISASVLAPRPDWLEHAEWAEKFTPYDLIFPLFVTLSGCGLAFAYRNRVPARVTVRRVVVLGLAGLLYNALVSGVTDLSVWRITGPLQTYAVLVAVVAALHTVIRSARGWALFAVALAVVDTCFLRWWVTDCDGGLLTRACNPSGVIDLAVMGAHMYRGGVAGHDPEGLIALIGMLVTVSAGVTAGHLALGSRGRDVTRGPLRLGAWAVILLGIAAALTLFIDPFKRLWTPSFALGTAALGVFLFGACFLIFDARTLPLPRPLALVAWPFVALGRNSLLVYFGSHVLISLMLRSSTGQAGLSMADQLAGTMAWVSSPQIGFVVLTVVFWWALALVLHRFKIYVHA